MINTTNKTVFMYALRRGFLSYWTLTFNVVLPIIIIFIPIMWDDDGWATGYSYLALTLMTGAFFMAYGLIKDMISGTIIRILAGPITSRGYLIQNLLAAMLPMFIISVMLGALGIVLYGWGINFALAIALCYTLLSASSVGLAFAWSCLFKNEETSFSVFMLFIMMSAYLGGLVFPMDLLPITIQRFGALFPSHWAARAINNLQEYGANGEYWLSILTLILFTTAYILYGSKRRVI